MTAYEPGDFNWSPDEEALRLAYQAVTETDGWTFLKTYVPTKGFMYDTMTPKMTEISNKVSELYPGHSGFSYGFTMRHMHALAMLGWELYLKKLEVIPSDMADRARIQELEAPNRNAEQALRNAEEAERMRQFAAAAHSLLPAPAPPRTFTHHSALSDEENRDADYAEEMHLMGGPHHMEVYTAGWIKCNDALAKRNLLLEK
jgi:hypothetical protein